MKKPAKPIDDPEVTLTFASARDAANFAKRVMTNPRDKKRLPFTRSVYRVAQTG